MAPVGTVDMLGWFSSPEVGIISLIVFLVLSITLVALCARCRRNSGNAYDVSGGGATQTDGVVAANDTKTSGPTDSGAVAYSTWRNHKDMPASTLERSMTSTD
ncbi:hypothetical protein INR49_004388 [Scomber scombrus]|uniref:Uncharacterized protein n=1 Tax=Scomber scombrus TaxID=13677 RepID=A0AAV1NUZ5_SCOSC